MVKIWRDCAGRQWNLHLWKYLKKLGQGPEQPHAISKLACTEQGIRLDGLLGFIQTYAILGVWSCKPLRFREILDEYVEGIIQILIHLAFPCTPR